MATEAETRPLDDAAPKPDTSDETGSRDTTVRVENNIDSDSRDTTAPDTLKRKASMDDRESSPKRIRNDADDRPRRDSSTSRRGSRANDCETRKNAMQEEKKRGKRLFGGLLSTLSQTSGNTQQKRRREIEQRQQERMRKQRAEDDKERAVKRASLTEIRMAEQIVFDEEVMRNKHSKILATAQYLQTRSEPQIFYLPWKLTEAQESQIDEQTRRTRTQVDGEVEAFKARKESHLREHGRSKRSATPGESAPAAEAVIDKSPSTNGMEEQDRGHQHHHHHDESADMVEEAEEDMVIY